jgi:hypothetical protein
MLPIKKRKRISRTPYRKPEYKKARYAMYKSPRLGWPQEYVSKFKFTTLARINNPGTTFATFSLRSNAYDVDPAIASTAMPGFAEYAAIYQRFRTLKMSYTAEFVNEEVFPLMCAAIYTNTNAPVINHTSMGNPLCKYSMMGETKGASKARLTDSQTIVAIAGTKQALYDDVYTGSTTSSTLAASGTCYVFFFIESPLAILVSGASVLVVFELEVQFYRPNVLNA